jgi:hypothetical protein
MRLQIFRRGTAGSEFLSDCSYNPLLDGGIACR